MRPSAAASVVGERTIMPSTASQNRKDKPSVHHERQMARLRSASAVASFTRPQQSQPREFDATMTAVVPPLVQARRPGSKSLVLTRPPSSARSPSSASAAAKTMAPVRPMSSGVFKPRAKIERTRFRYFYDRGDLPVRVNFAGAVRKLQWQVDLSHLDYAHYLPLFMEGLRELDEPYQFLAETGVHDLLEKGEARVLPCIALLIAPIRQNLLTRHQKIMCRQLHVLQKLLRCCPFAGEALVPFYRQLLSVFNQFITKRVNCGDGIDYGQQRQSNIGDLVMETLVLLETQGGRDAFVNIKYMIPTYESCCSAPARQ